MAKRAEKRGGLASIRDALKAYLTESGLNAKLQDWPVFDAWSAVLGQPLDQRARPVRFRRGELLVEVDSAALLQELQNYTAERYRMRANQRLGRNSIQSVVVKLKR